MKWKKYMEHDTLNHSSEISRCANTGGLHTCKYFATNYWISCLTVVRWILERNREGWEALDKCKHTRGITFLDELSTKIKQTLFFYCSRGFPLVFMFAYPLSLLRRYFFLTVKLKKISSIFVTRNSIWRMRRGEKSFCFVGFAELAEIIFMFVYDLDGLEKRE